MEQTLMGDVVELRRPGERWCGGTVKCLRCSHEWVVVRQVPSETLECPKCGCFTGVAKGIFAAQEGKARWACVCGNTLLELIVDRDGSEELLCIGCGAGKPVKT